MNRGAKDLLRHLLAKRCIGGKHIPESIVMAHLVFGLDRNRRRELEKDYRDLLNNGTIMRMKKRTGKGSDWHISLNPRKMDEIYWILREGGKDEDSNWDFL